MAKTTSGPWGELTIEVEQIDVTSNLPTRDEKWTYTDQQGHEHYWRDGYPTLTWVIDETWYDEDLDEDVSDGHYECTVCGETVVPGLRGPDTFRRFVPGRRSYRLNDEPITEEQAKQIMQSMR